MDFVKGLLILFNIIFVLAGITLVGIGIWTAVEKIYVGLVIGSDLFSAVSYMMITVGAITICICLLGIYCALKEKLRWTMLYFGLLILASVTLLITAIIAVVFQAEAENVMVSEMRDSLINGYGNDGDVTNAWDQVQGELECCAISKILLGEGSPEYALSYIDGTEPSSQREREAQDSWAIYKRTMFYKNQMNLAPSYVKYVPASCCVYDDLSNEYLDKQFCQNFVNGPPTNYVNDLENRYLHYDGCYEKAKSLIMDQSTILIGLGFVFAFLMIAGIVLTFILMRRISNEKHSETKRRREPDNL